MAEAAPAVKSLNESERADVARIEAYLNGVRTMRARFSQFNNDGSGATGSIYVSRPGRMRVEYDPPTPVLIVATGIWLIYFDKQIGQVSHLPLNASPAAFLVRDSLQFTRDSVILGFEKGPGSLRLTIADKSDPGGGRITLVFSDSPLTLLKWTVVDAQGLMTNIALSDTAFGLPLAPQLFQFVDPTPDRIRPRN
ncbi:MAG: LolA family protein [Alphaproteobacteria bacterium]